MKPARRSHRRGRPPTGSSTRLGRGSTIRVLVGRRALGAGAWSRWRHRWIVPRGIPRRAAAARALIPPAIIALAAKKSSVEWAAIEHMFPSYADGMRRRPVASSAPQGSKLVVHARGLQNREPGFESRLPCQWSRTRSTGRSPPRSAANSSESPTTSPMRSGRRGSPRAWRSCARCTSPRGFGSTTTSPACRPTSWSGWTSWRRRAGRRRPPRVARELSPDPGDYRHHRGGEDNGDAHLKNLLVHHQVIVPVTDGALDLGPWQQVFYCEFDGGRPKRLVIKVLGE